MIELVTLSIFVTLCLMGTVKSSWAIALLVLFFALEVTLQASVAQFRANLPLANFFLAGVLAISLLKSLSHQRSPFTGTFGMAFVCVLAIFVWSLVSLAWTPAVPDAPNHGSNIIRSEWPYVVIVVLAAPILIDGLSDWDSARSLILVLGSAIVLTVLVNPEFTVKYGRIGVVLDGVTRTSPLAIGEMGGTLAIVGGLYRTQVAGRASVTLGLAAFLLGMLLALYSGSRGQAVFALVSMILMFPVSRQMKNVRAFLGGAIVLLIALVGVYFAFSSIAGSGDIDRWRSDRVQDAGGIRMQNIGLLLSAFAQDPRSWVLGLGFNAFSTLGNDLGQGYSHSTFADVLCELGIPSFVALLTVCFLVFRAGRSLFDRYRDLPAQRSAVATLLALVVYQFLICNKEGHLWSSVNFFLFCLMVIRIDRRESMELPQIALDGTRSGGGGEVATVN
jgi:hypothetical protein